MLLKSVLLHGEYMVVGASEFFLTFQAIFIRTDSTKSTGICHKPHPTCILLQPILCQWEMCLPHTVFFCHTEALFPFCIWENLVFRSLVVLYGRMMLSCPVASGGRLKKRERGRKTLLFSLLHSLSLSFPPPLKGTIPHTPLSFPSFFGSFVKLSPFWHVKSALFSSVFFSTSFFHIAEFSAGVSSFTTAKVWRGGRGRKKEAWMESALL